MWRSDEQTTTAPECSADALTDKLAAECRRPSRTSQTQPRGRRLARSLGLLTVLLFLLAGAAARVQALATGDAASSALVAVALLAPAACLLRPAWLGPVLELFGASLFLYGFHSYRPQSLAFELVLSALAAVLVIRSRADAARVRRPASSWSCRCSRSMRPSRASHCCCCLRAYSSIAPF